MFHIFAWSPDIIWVFAQKLWWFVVLLGILIAFHEFGHFLAARLVGVRVLKFSLGFGPKLFGRQIGETEYLVSAVPLGGYVKLFGEEEADALSPEQKERSFVHKSLSRRMFIVAAGPAFNFLLAYLIFVGWLATGAPLFVPSFEDVAPDIEVVMPGSPADRAGLKLGDRVIRINERDISIRDEVFVAVEKSKGKQLTIDVRRGDDIKTFLVTPLASTIEREGKEHVVYKIGIEDTPPALTDVKPGSPAEIAGFQAGDRVVSIEGREIHTWGEMTAFVKDSADQPLRFQVMRNGQLVDLVVTPAARKRTADGKPVGPAIIGISRTPGLLIEADNLFVATIEGARGTWKWTEFILVTLQKLITGEISRKNIAGPLGIASISGEAAEQGASTFIWIIALLSINLGVLNLLPIPILDGGHLMFFIIEAILRKPLGERQREIAQQVGLVLLLFIMVFALWNDIERVLSR